MPTPATYFNEREHQICLVTNHTGIIDDSSVMQLLIVESARLAPSLSSRHAA